MTFFEEKMASINNGPVRNEQIVDTIKSLVYFGYTLKQIDTFSKRYNIYNFIDAILKVEPNNQMLLKAIREYYQNLKVESNRCLVISDTHIGRLREDEKNVYKELYENEKMLNIAYEYALRNGITTVLHLGDLIEGNSDPYIHRMNVDWQLSYIEKIYPQVKEINTYLLYGNHDFNAISYEHIDPKFYKRCLNMQLIGVKSSYINLDNQIIGLYHQCDMAKNQTVYLAPDLKLYGHTHSYNADQLSREVKAPCMASTGMVEDSIGFLELISDEMNFIIRLLDKNANIKKEDRLTKRLIFY